MKLSILRKKFITPQSAALETLPKSYVRLRRSIMGAEMRRATAERQDVKNLPPPDVKSVASLQ